MMVCKDNNTKKSNPGSIIHDDNSMSPQPPTRTFSNPSLIPHQQALAPSSATPSVGKKRHRSHDSEKVEENSRSSAAKKRHSNRFGEREDGSFPLTLEINGTRYQGVLFAKPNQNQTSSL